MILAAFVHYHTSGTGPIPFYMFIAVFEALAGVVLLAAMLWFTRRSRR
jgi:hypothetical protein